jgi:hypothetical protein
MGDFGVGFLYVRPDRLKDLERVLVGSAPGPIRTGAVCTHPLRGLSVLLDHLESGIRRSMWRSLWRAPFGSG